jgi:hypothetical protein
MVIHFNSDLAEAPERGNPPQSSSGDIALRYQVQNRNYTTETLHFGQTFASGDSSESALRRLEYPAGAEIPVFYHPRDPSIAVVRTGVFADAFWLPLAGLAFALPGAMVPFIVLNEGSRLRIALGVFGIAFCTVGGLMLAGGLTNLWRGHASTRWPITNGTIVHERVDSSTTVTRDNNGNVEQSTTHATHLVYEYTVDGKKHYANVRRFGELAGAGEDWAAEIAERYPTGHNVRVWYCPYRPELAALEPVIASEAFWLPGAGFVILAFGSAVLRWGIPALTGPFPGGSAKR